MTRGRTAREKAPSRKGKPKRSKTASAQRSQTKKPTTRRNKKATETGESEHAVLSASASHRWINCPGSVRLSEGRQSPPSVYAAEGTAAHELAAHCLETGKSAFDFLGTQVNGFEVTDEMAEAIDLYLTVIRDIIKNIGTGIEVFVEKKFHLDWLHPGLFGTNDAVVIEPFGKLHVFDFKYGAGVAVEAKENTQLIYYALGAAYKSGCEEIALTIVQPRAPHPAGSVRVWEITRNELTIWGQKIRSAALRTEEVSAPLTAGEWCRWCPASPVCPALKKRVQETAVSDFSGELVKPKELSREQITTVLQNAELVKAWVSDVESYALQLLLHGEEIPGFKIVHGRSNRQWKEGEADRAVGFLKKHLGPSCVMDKPKPLSIAAIERKIKKKWKGDTRKKKLALLEKWVTKPEGKPTIVPVGDAREPMKSDAQRDFEPITKPKQLTSNTSEKSRASKRGREKPNSNLDIFA